MRLTFIADGRSPIARNWIRYFIEHGSEVHLISTSFCSEIRGLKSLHVVPVAFSGLRRQGRSSEGGGALTSARTIGLRTFIRHWLGPATIGGSARKVSSLVSEIKPDLVHAMRIPFEGAVASSAAPPAPLLISVWGNDFTLHAPASPMMRGMTQRTLARTDALHTDTQRDGQLAVQWGFDRQRPQLVMPGNGGVRREVFYPGAPEADTCVGGTGARGPCSRQSAGIPRLRQERYVFPLHSTGAGASPAGGVPVPEHGGSSSGGGVDGSFRDYEIGAAAAHAHAVGPGGGVP